LLEITVSIVITQEEDLTYICRNEILLLVNVHSVLFNTLPVNVKCAKTLPRFRGLIKTHFLGC
jgi:hypothetical protein